jgi:hypothetical protein
LRRVRQRRRRFTHHVDAYLIPAIGRLRRTAVTVRHLAAMFAELAAAATPTGRLKTPATPQRIRATLAGRLQRAIRDGVVADNPSRRVGMPVPRRPHAVVWTERAGCSKWRPTGTGSRWRCRPPPSSPSSSTPSPTTRCSRCGG